MTNSYYYTLQTISDTNTDTDITDTNITNTDIIDTDTIRLASTANINSTPPTAAADKIANITC